MMKLILAVCNSMNALKKVIWKNSDSFKGFVIKQYSVNF